MSFFFSNRGELCFSWEECSGAEFYSVSLLYEVDWLRSMLMMPRLSQNEGPCFRGETLVHLCQECAAGGTSKNPAGKVSLSFVYGFDPCWSGGWHCSRCSWYLFIVYFFCLMFLFCFLRLEQTSASQWFGQVFGGEFSPITVFFFTFFFISYKKNFF